MPYNPNAGATHSRPDCQANATISVRSREARSATGTISGPAHRHAPDLIASIAREAQHSPVIERPTHQLVFETNRRLRHACPLRRFGPRARIQSVKHVPLQLPEPIHIDFRQRRSVHCSERKVRDLALAAARPLRGRRQTASTRRVAGDRRDKRLSTVYA